MDVVFFFFFVVYKHLLVARRELNVYFMMCFANRIASSSENHLLMLKPTFALGCMHNLNRLQHLKEA